MRLKEARDRKGLTQRQLGQLIGISPSGLSKIELGLRQLSVRWAIKLAPALGVLPTELLQGEVLRESAKPEHRIDDFEFDLTP